MSETLQTTDIATSDADLLDRTATAVRAAGAALRERFGDVVRYKTREELMHALAVNDNTALDILRPRLTSLRPEAGWVEDELDGGALPPGEWWVVDPAEGNVNHLHALPEWAVTATLVRENQPVLTVVHLPLTGETYTALTGGRRPPRRSAAAHLRHRGPRPEHRRHQPGPPGRGREGRTARRLLDHRDALRRAGRPHRRARDPAPDERGRRADRRLLAVHAAPERTSCPVRCSSPKQADGSPTPRAAPGPRRATASWPPRPASMPRPSPRSPADPAHHTPHPAPRTHARTTSP